MSNFKTHIPLSPDDPNSFYLVRNGDQRQLTNNFTASEFFNPKNGLREHPIAVKVVEAVQYIRNFFGVPIRITSTYRNYVPGGSGVVNAAKRSPHMLAQAVDAQFVVDVEKRDAMMIYLRNEFDAKGLLFQVLFESYGVRGFGVYDNFFHLDVVPVELYEVFRAKRKSVYQSYRYAYWNDMMRLRYQQGTVFMPQPILDENNEETVEFVEVENEVGALDLVQEKVASGAGSVVGFFRKLQNTDDGFTDVDNESVLYSLFSIATLIALIYLIVLLVR